MIQLHVTDEISRLRAVVLGTAISNGPIPNIEDAYDPKSAEHIKAGTYPKEEDMIRELEAVAAVFKKYDVKVYRPTVIENYNQIFCRDIAFVIDDKIIMANILPDRKREIDAIEHVWSQIPKENRIMLPEKAHIEGGDVMPWGDYIFVGTYYGDDYFHLDCCFQPIGKGKCIIHKEGFLEEEEYQWLVNFFGKENCFQITKDEMYNMNSNIFSISPDVIISEQNFTRLNTWLRSEGFTVEEVPYAEIAKQEGLFRCTTMPLIRD
jgi:N-dimethylarginine dimethylaminohydrolase